MSFATSRGGYVTRPHSEYPVKSGSLLSTSVIILRPFRTKRKVFSVRATKTYSREFGV